MYHDRISTIKIGKILGFSPKFIQKTLKENGVQLRKLFEINRKCSVNDHLFDVVDSEEKAYFLGMLFSDGNVCKSPTNNAITLKLNKRDRDILTRLSNLVFGTIRLYESKSDDSLMLKFSSPFLKQKLIELGCVPAKSLVLKFPEIEPKLWRHFIRGYLDGDGSIPKCKTKSKTRFDYHLTIASTEQFCQTVKNIILNATGIEGTITKDKESVNRGNEITSVLAYKGNRRVERILDWLYENSLIFMERKHQKYLMLKDWIADVDKRFGNRYKLRLSPSA